jgi:hypothetical protein
MSLSNAIGKPNTVMIFGMIVKKYGEGSQASIADSVDEVQEPWRPQVELAETSMM